MNLIADNSLTYSGNIELKIVSNGKEYAFKNSGTPALFKLFGRALSGYNVTNDTPYYLSGTYVIGSSTSAVSFLRNCIYLTGRAFVDSAEGGVTRLTATLTTADLQNIPLSQTGVVYTFQLLAKDKSTILAEITVTDNSLFENLPTNARILIEWNMKVRN